MTGNVDAISIGTDGAGGATTTYDFADLTAPVVTTQPQSQTYTSGATITLTAAASGNPTPTVQWQFSLNGGAGWANISGANSPSYTNGPYTSFQNHWEFRAVFTNSQGTAASNGATLTLATAPVVTTQPKSQTYSSGATITLTAAASGNPTPTVQWQFSLNGGAGWANISGANSPSYTNGPYTSFQNHWEFRAVFTNSAGSAASNGATLTLK